MPKLPLKIFHQRIEAAHGNSRSSTSELSPAPHGVGIATLGKTGQLCCLSQKKRKKNPKKTAKKCSGHGEGKEGNKNKGRLQIWKGHFCPLGAPGGSRNGRDLGKRSCWELGGIVPMASSPSLLSCQDSWHSQSTSSSLRQLSREVSHSPVPVPRGSF